MTKRKLKQENQVLRDKISILDELIINLRGELKATKMKLESKENNDNQEESKCHKASITCTGCRNLIVTTNSFGTAYDNYFAN